MIDEKQLELKTDIYIKMIPTVKLMPGELFARTEYSPSAFRLLCRSITRFGVIEPLTVTRFLTGYKIISGERRYYAAKKAGLKYLPCIVREKTSEAEQLTLKLTSKSLSVFEIADAVAAMSETDSETAGITHTERKLITPPAKMNAKQRLKCIDAGLTEERIRDIARKTESKQWNREIEKYKPKKKKVKCIKADNGLLINSVRKLCETCESLGVEVEYEEKGSEVILRTKARKKTEKKGN